jgi:predicted tellurium resistance membrane protein TerC
MFGISIAIIFPMVLLVIYTTRLSITKVIIRLKKRVVSWKWFHMIRWERQRKEMKRQWEEKDGDYASSSGFVEEKEQAKKRVPFWRRQVEKESVIVDAEKGVNGKFGD